MKKPTQEQWIIVYMKKYGSITPKEAIYGYSIMRLASRICDLRKQGYKIKSEMVYKDGEHFARYSLEEDNSEA